MSKLLLKENMISAGELLEAFAERERSYRAEKRRTEFDQYKESYLELVEDSIAFAGKGHEFYTELKANILLELVTRRFGTTRLCALDVGCGQGFTDSYLSGRFRSLSGVDISAESVAKASMRNPGVDYRVCSGGQIPHQDNTFDVVFAINVMHHVPPDQWGAFVSELHRVSKHSGLVVVFEHNGLNPLTRRSVSTCVFDKDAVLLSPKTVGRHFLKQNLVLHEQRYILFFPFHGALFRKLERGLSWCPLGAQYYVAAVKPGMHPVPLTV